MEAAKLADDYSILTCPFKMNSSAMTNFRNSRDTNDNWRKPYSNFGSPPVTTFDTTETWGGPQQQFGPLDWNSANIQDGG